MLRTFTFRLHPNATQRASLERILVDNCETYNAALQERRDAWKLQRKSVGVYEQMAELTSLRSDGSYNWLACDIMRDPLRRVDRAFKAFFRRCKSGEKPGFPRFRSRDRYDSFTMAQVSSIRERSIRIPLVGDIRMRGGRSVEGKPKTVTVKRNGTTWDVRIVCDIGPAPEKRVVSRAVGIDLGVKELVVLSDGTKIENPHWTKRHAARIAAAGRALARKQRRSKNRQRAKDLLRRAHQRAANARLNYLHHASQWLVQQYDLIAHEDLKIRNMAQSNLAKSIMDAAWGQLLFQLKYKAESAGTYVVAVNPRGTSIRCSGCGEPVPKTLADRQHICGACGLSLDRDHNAARNVLALGMSAAGLAPHDVYSGT